MEELPLMARARGFGDRVAVRSGTHNATYRDLLDHSGRLAAVLLKDREDLNDARIAFLLPAGFDYVAVQWAIWRAGGVVVPLCLSATPPELQYTLEDSKAECLVTTREFADRARPLCDKLSVRLVLLDEETSSSEKPLPLVSPDRRAMILYTSGTTNKPKGVVTTHANIAAQVESLVSAWEWQAEDTIPLFLPLHHIHGIVNILCCAMWSGAAIEPFAKFDSGAVLRRVAEKAYTLFMAVPTIYVKLIEALEQLPREQRAPILAGFGAMRLMVSGSAALPASIHEQWSALTGQRLLERYGMTETGMGLSNPYCGERRAGTVGQPLPGVEIRLLSEEGKPIREENLPGEIQVRGPGVFLEYWNRPEATAESFVDGWFRTGDIADIEDGYYRIMGRQSVDIIKSGGYKLSALEIEAQLLEHPAIGECAVVGLADGTWGEIVAAAVVLARNETLTLEELRTWCQDRLSAYKIPKRLLPVGQLPRNAMGKVAKPAVRELFG